MELCRTELRLGSRDRRKENHRPECCVLKGQVSPGLGRIIGNPGGEAFVSNPEDGDAFRCQVVAIDQGPQP